MTSPGVTPAGPGPGDPAPLFRLRHTFDHDVGLAETLARGPVVLAFYVFDFGFA
jgi:peroxiredoxin